jgi:hypothetical protein
MITLTTQSNGGLSRMPSFRDTKLRGVNRKRQLGLSNTSLEMAYPSRPFQIMREICAVICSSILLQDLYVRPVIY